MIKFGKKYQQILKIIYKLDTYYQVSNLQMPN